MSADGFYAASDVEIVSAVLNALRSDADVRELLGDPARIYDDETRSPVFPYAVLERHERLRADVSEVCGAEHRLTLATYSRLGGRIQAKAILGALRAAVDRLEVNLSQQRIVLAYVTYSDALRARDQISFRGILRIKIITEEV